MNYRQRLSQTQDQKDANHLNHTVESAKLQAQRDLLETQYRLGELKAELEKLRGSQDYSIADIVSKQQEVEALTTTLEIGNKLFEEDFSEQSTK